MDLGCPRAEIVQLFGVSLATIKRYLKHQREEGHVRPKTIAGRPPKKRAQVEADVLPQLQARDDATLEHHCAMWEQTHGERVSRWTMAGRSKDLAGREKKSLGATERNEEERAAWRGSDRMTGRTALKSAHGVKSSFQMSTSFYLFILKLDIHGESNVQFDMSIWRYALV